MTLLHYKLPYSVSDSSVRFRFINLLIIVIEGEDIFVCPEDEGPEVETAMTMGQAEVAQIESQEL